ncbi:hypothetical protein QN328_02050 [Streptococcus agalactiae]|uniref:hypothetical protein n=1 Tax=Streptococcus agalactiae TaxID=1311 RepID=UPI0024157D2E|nr:hypothetical protein [Streptococcus agalactiae]
MIPDSKTKNKSIANISDIDNSIKSIDSYIKNHQSEDELVVAINLKTIEVVIDFFKEIANG